MPLCSVTALSLMAPGRCSFPDRAEVVDANGAEPAALLHNALNPLSICLVGNVHSSPSPTSGFAAPKLLNAQSARVLKVVILMIQYRIRPGNEFQQGHMGLKQTIEEAVALIWEAADLIQQSPAGLAVRFRRSDSRSSASFVLFSSISISSAARDSEISDFHSAAPHICAADR